ncbi:MAG: hypothetical protein QXI19_03460 [Candidatus Caldarchaeum sp.]
MEEPWLHDYLAHIVPTTEEREAFPYFYRWWKGYPLEARQVVIAFLMSQQVWLPFSYLVYHFDDLLVCAVGGSVSRAGLSTNSC